MDRSWHSTEQRNAKAKPLLPAQYHRGHQEHESRQPRVEKPAKSPPRLRLPVHRRRASQEHGDVDVRLISPVAQSVPYSPFPIPANSFAQRAVQYYIKEYSPASVKRPHFEGLGQDLVLLRDYVPFVMNDRMVFSALVGMASFLAHIATTGNREAPSESLRYYQSAVSQLRERLSSESDKSSDAVIVTLSNLCGFEALSGNYDAVDMHTLGIKQLVSLRGGPDQLGFEGFMKTMVVAWQSFYSARHSLDLTDEHFFPRDGVFTYPVHPFEPDLCDAIARFHPGLTDIALSGLLSHHVINLVAHISTWDKGITSCLKDSDVYSLQDFSHSARNVTLCGEYLHRRGLSLVEQLLVLTMLTFCFSTDTSRAMMYLTSSFLQTWCKFKRSVFIEVNERNEKFMTWVGTMLVSTFDPGVQPFLLGLELLRARPTPRNWQDNVQLCETYFWNDSFSLRLASRIGHLAEAERQGQG